MPKDRGDELLIDRDTVAAWPRKLRVKKLLGVLPDLGSVSAKREPESDQVRLEVAVS